MRRILAALALAAALILPTVHAQAPQAREAVTWPDGKPMSDADQLEYRTGVAIGMQKELVKIKPEVKVTAGGAENRTLTLAWDDMEQTVVDAMMGEKDFYEGLHKAGFTSAIFKDSKSDKSWTRPL